MGVAVFGNGNAVSQKVGDAHLVVAEMSGYELDGFTLSPQPDDIQFPLRYYIDYVRVYKGEKVKR